MDIVLDNLDQIVSKHTVHVDERTHDRFYLITMTKNRFVFYHYEYMNDEHYSLVFDYTNQDIPLSELTSELKRYKKNMTRFIIKIKADLYNLFKEDLNSNTELKPICTINGVDATVKDELDMYDDFIRRINDLNIS